jgi:hypothetical protein
VPPPAPAKPSGTPADKTAAAPADKTAAAPADPAQELMKKGY